MHSKPIAHPSPWKSRQPFFYSFLYTGWPDHGVPQNATSLIKFIRRAHELNRAQNDDNGPPMIVGCSAGIGRTGSFIAICSLLRSHCVLGVCEGTNCDLVSSSPLGALPLEISSDLVAQEVDNLREQRGGMVQTPQQLQFIYESALECLC